MSEISLFRKKRRSEFPIFEVGGSSLNVEHEGSTNKRTDFVTY